MTRPQGPWQGSLKGGAGVQFPCSRRRDSNKLDREVGKSAQVIECIADNNYYGSLECEQESPFSISERTVTSYCQ